MIQIIHVQDSGFLILLNIFLYSILGILVWKYLSYKKKEADSDVLLAVYQKLEDLSAKMAEAQERIDTISIKVGMTARFINEKSDKNK